MCFGMLKITDSVQGNQDRVSRNCQNVKNEVFDTKMALFFFAFVLEKDREKRRKRKKENSKTCPEKMFWVGWGIQGFCENWHF